MLWYTSISRGQDRKKRGRTVPRMVTLMLFGLMFLSSSTHGLRYAARSSTVAHAAASTYTGTSSSRLMAVNGGGGNSGKKFPLRLPTAYDKKTPELQKEETERVQRAMKFLDSSPEPFHCVSTVEAMLQAAGFEQLKEDTLWRKTGAIKKGGKYYFTRNGSSMLAFCVGKQWSEDKSGFKIIGAHTDSPNLKLKPRTKKTASGLVQLNVECYGGGLWHTWFDRDLALAGRVIVRDGDDSFSHRLVRVHRPVLRVPNLCIHLRSADEREVFKVNHHPSSPITHHHPSPITHHPSSPINANDTIPVGEQGRAHHSHSMRSCGKDADRQQQQQQQQYGARITSSITRRGARGGPMGLRAATRVAVAAQKGTGD